MTKFLLKKKNHRKQNSLSVKLNISGFIYSVFLGLSPVKRLIISWLVQISGFSLDQDSAGSGADGSSGFFTCVLSSCGLRDAEDGGPGCTPCTDRPTPPPRWSSPSTATSSPVRRRTWWWPGRRSSASTGSSTTWR